MYISDSTDGNTPNPLEHYKLINKTRVMGVKSRSSLARDDR